MSFIKHLYENQAVILTNAVYKPDELYFPLGDKRVARVYYFNPLNQAGVSFGLTVRIISKNKGEVDTTVFRYEDYLLHSGTPINKIDKKARDKVIVTLDTGAAMPEMEIRAAVDGVRDLSLAISAYVKLFV